MRIELLRRTEQHVRIYFRRAQDPEIRAMLPSGAATVEQALENYRGTLLPGASSYGKTVYADGVYIGDIWCYGIDPDGEPSAMLSYCIFEKAYWGKGVMSTVLPRFLEELGSRIPLVSVGAFTFADNAASVRVLEKNGFSVRERFAGGRGSLYLQLDIR